MIELMMFVLTSVAAGVLGNRSDALLCDVARSLYERLRQSGPPVNHDLQRAIRKAFLQATLALLSDALRRDVPNLFSRFLRRLWSKDQEVRWLLRAYDALAAELRRVSDAKYAPPSSVAESVAKRELAFLLEPQGVAAEERGRELRERLTEEWLQELRGRFGEPPEVFIRRLREGWKPPEGEGTVSWFDLVCVFFAHEVKHNQASPTSSPRSCWRAWRWTDDAWTTSSASTWKGSSRLFWNAWRPFNGNWRSWDGSSGKALRS
jgi:hypothetical protein